MRGGRKTTLAVVAGGLGAAVALAGTTMAASGAGDETAQRQQVVANRGEDVMGFDLETTVHRFGPTSSGGVQDVVVVDTGDAAEVEDIRAHLQEEAEHWRLGDFSAPAVIHGEDMPGLKELESAGTALQVRYSPLPDGGRVTFTSSRRDIVEALHAWFDAQLGDHGEHAEHGMS